MKTNYFIYYQQWAVVLVVGLCLIGTVKIQEIHWSYSIISLLGLGIVLEVIDRCWWKYPLFSWLFTVRDFSGTYEGEQIGYRIDKNGETENGEILYGVIETPLKIKMIINQTGSSITIYSFYYNASNNKSSKSQSELLSMGLTKDGKHYTIVYHYHNKGNEKWDGHFGTTVMTLLKENNQFTISGNYYTDRKPQTRGEFKNLKRISKQTNHPF